MTTWSLFYCNGNDIILYGRLLKKNRQKIISLIVCGKFKLIAFCVCFEKEINSVKFKKLESLLLVYVDKLYLCFVDAEDLFRGKKRTFFHNYVAYMEYKR